MLKYLAGRIVGMLPAVFLLVFFVVVLIQLIPGNIIDLMLDQWGPQLGVETRTESTVVRGAVLSSKLPEFLALIREILSLPAFPEGEIAKLTANTSRTDTAPA